MEGILKPENLEYAIEAPRMRSFGAELYPSLAEKAAVLGFSLMAGHVFADGNKRIGYASMEFFLMKIGFEIKSTVDEAEEITLKVAEKPSEFKDEWFMWVRDHMVKLQNL
jgi:death-on-curing protein